MSPKKTSASGSRRQRNSRRGVRTKRRTRRSGAERRRKRRPRDDSTLPSVVPIVESTATMEDSEEELILSQRSYQGKSDRLRVLSSEGDDVEKPPDVSSPAAVPPESPPVSPLEMEQVQPVESPAPEPMVVQSSPARSSPLTSPAEPVRNYGQQDMYHPWQDSGSHSRSEVQPQTPHTPSHSYQQHVSPPYHSSPQPPSIPAESAAELPGWVDPPAQNQPQFLQQTSNEPLHHYPSQSGFDQQYTPHLVQTTEPQQVQPFNSSFMPSVMNTRTSSPFREGYSQINPGFSPSTILSHYPPGYGGSPYGIQSHPASFQPRMQYPFFSRSMHQSTDMRGEVPSWHQQHQIHPSRTPPHLQRTPQQPSPPHRPTPTSGTGRGYSINSILENTSSGRTGSPVPPQQPQQQQQQPQHMHTPMQGYPNFVQQPPIMTQEQANYSNLVRYRTYMEQLARMRSSAAPSMYHMGGVPPFVHPQMQHLNPMQQQQTGTQEPAIEEPPSQQESTNPSQNTQ